MASQFTVMSVIAIDVDISSGSASPAPPENSEVREEFERDSALFNPVSRDKLSSLWALRDKVVWLTSFGGVPTWRSASVSRVKCRDIAVILVEGEVER
jgi:hypothetical protein